MNKPVLLSTELGRNTSPLFYQLLSLFVCGQNLFTAPRHCFSNR